MIALFKINILLQVNGNQRHLTRYIPIDYF